MTKVYLVSSGSYSDYSIDAVFSSEENAQTFIDSFDMVGGGYGGFNSIEEYPVDQCLKEASDGNRLCFIRISRHGDTSDFRFANDAYGINHIEDVRFDNQGNLYVYCFAKDKEHAIKIAGERRARLIANNEWK